MTDAQGLIFREAAGLAPASGLALLGLGLLALLQGFRFGRFLIPAICAAGGSVVGVAIADALAAPRVLGLVPGLGLLALGLVRYRKGVSACSGLVAGALFFYLAQQVGLGRDATLIVAGAAAALGVALIWVCPRALPILITVAVGSGLLVAAFVALTSVMAPTLGDTFQAWACDHPLLVPMFMVMLWVLGYSVQANARQGDMQTGGDGGLADLELS